MGGLDLRLLLAPLRFLAREHACEYLSDQLDTRKQVVRPLAVAPHRREGERTHDRVGHRERHDQRGANAERAERRQVRMSLGRKLRETTEAYGRTGKKPRADPRHRERAHRVRRRRDVLRQPAMRLDELAGAADPLPQRRPLGAEQPSHVA
ncbi:MAG: hypothetical protein M5U08_19975 [Burkholderiales bacterium]|nr:hypothetical protein [Burkholderiales bacterium]